MLITCTVDSRINIKYHDKTKKTSHVNKSSGMFIFTTKLNYMQRVVESPRAKGVGLKKKVVNKKVSINAIHAFLAQHRNAIQRSGGKKFKHETSHWDPFFLD